MSQTSTLNPDFEDFIRYSRYWVSASTYISASGESSTYVAIVHATAEFMFRHRSTPTTSKRSSFGLVDIQKAVQGSPYFPKGTGAIGAVANVLIGDAVRLLTTYKMLYREELYTGDGLYSMANAALAEVEEAKKIARERNAPMVLKIRRKGRSLLAGGLA